MLKIVSYNIREIWNIFGSSIVPCLQDYSTKVLIFCLCLLIKSIERMVKATLREN